MDESGEESGSEEGNKGDELCLKGDCALYGHGETQNFEKAKELYEEARKLRSARVFRSLGKMYEMGIGVEKDYNEAYNLYKEGASLNDEGLSV